MVVAMMAMTIANVRGNESGRRLVSRVLTITMAASAASAPGCNLLCPSLLSPLNANRKL
jgi:hypothetical protein